MARPNLTLEERFAKSFRKSPDGCWIWTGGRTYAYGSIYEGHKRHRAHRLSWVLKHGEIGPGLVVCHRCDNPLCVNPDHLFLGTQGDNIRDMYEKGRGGPRFRGARAHGNAVLTVEQARAIRDKFHAKVPRRHIAREFGISLNVVEQIGAGKAWTQVLAVHGSAR